MSERSRHPAVGGAGTLNLFSHIWEHASQDAACLPSPVSPRGFPLPPPSPTGRKRQEAWLIGANSNGSAPLISGTAASGTRCLHWGLHGVRQALGTRQPLTSPFATRVEMQTGPEVTSREQCGAPVPGHWAPREAQPAALSTAHHVCQTSQTWLHRGRELP